ncbi:hypothetical protein GOBAR_DD18672 [Gossypium barbadense]|nr:hypothetical protein GOBAR_DD18672 [Gossypium barbadense]
MASRAYKWATSIKLIQPLLLMHVCAGTRSMYLGDSRHDIKTRTIPFGVHEWTDLFLLIDSCMSKNEQPHSSSLRNAHDMNFCFHVIGHNAPSLKHLHCRPCMYLKAN